MELEKVKAERRAAGGASSPKPTAHAAEWGAVEPLLQRLHPVPDSASLCKLELPPSGLQRADSRPPYLTHSGIKHDSDALPFPFPAATSHNALVSHRPVADTVVEGVS